MLLMCINPNLSFQYDMMLSRPWVTMGVVFSSVLDGSSDSSKHSTWLTSWLHWLHVTTPPTSAVGTSTSGSTPAAANSSNTVSPPGQPNVVISSPAISFPVTSYSVCVPIESMTENIPIYLSLSYPPSTPFLPPPGAHQSYFSVDRKFLDLFLSIHGDFFLLNPRSSFSWQVYVVRVCLGTLFMVADYALHRKLMFCI